MRLLSILSKASVYAALTTLTFAAKIGHASEQAGQDPLFDESASDPYLDNMKEPNFKESAPEADMNAPDAGVGVEDAAERFKFEDNDTVGAKAKAKAQAKKKVKLVRTVEINLAPTNFVKESPIAGGIGVSTEYEIKRNYSAYASFDFNRYFDLGPSIVHSEQPYNHVALSIPSTDHLRVTVGGRRYLQNGPHGGYVGVNAGIGMWQIDYRTDTRQPIADDITEAVFGAEMGYRWIAPKKPLVLRAGVGMGWALPLSREVSTPGGDYEKGLAHEISTLEFFQFRPTLQLGVGYSY